MTSAASALATVFALSALSACASEKFMDPGKPWEQSQHEQLFKMVDLNEDGRVDAEEFQRSYVQITWPYFDRDGDGRITLTEWALDGMTPEREAVFRGLDANGDGILTREEFSQASRPEVIQQYFELMDKNGDGYITKKELRQS